MNNFHTHTMKKSKGRKAKGELGKNKARKSKNTKYD